MCKLRRCLTVIARTGICLTLAIIAFGCATPVLDKARVDYYNNEPQKGLDALKEASIPDRDKILFLMEKGSLYQLQESYRDSSHDFNEASFLLGQMDTLSLTRGTGSMIASDNVLNFYGYPFERTYLHVINALNYIARSDWQGAGVEGRRIIKSLKEETLGDYPEDAFSRYIAGLCMDLVDDASNARVEYRKASIISKTLDVSDYGLLVKEGEIDQEDSSTQPARPDEDQHYLVCIVMVGRIANYSKSFPSKKLAMPDVKVSGNGQHLGKAETLVDLGHLAIESESQDLLKTATKTTARVAGKLVAVDAVSDQNELVGALLYLALMALEQPDYRHWETLPRFINICRIPCPADLETVKLSVAYSKGTKEIIVKRPLKKSGKLFITFERVL